jgi:hypothetical protein
MHLQDMRSDTTVAFGISATLSGATPAKGNIVDVTNHQAATFIYQTGVVTDAGDGTGFTLQIQESDTTVDGDFTAVADADLIGLETELTVVLDTADGVAIGCIGYRGNKKYVRAVVTGSTGTNAIVNGTWVLQRPRYAPQGNAAANIAAT